MDTKESLYSKTYEISNLRTKLRALKVEVHKLLFEKEIMLLNENINRLVELYQGTIINLENILDEKDKVSFTIREMRAMKSNFLPLPCNSYEDVLSLNNNVKKLLVLVAKPENYLYDLQDEFKLYTEEMQKFVNIHSKRLIEEDKVFRDSRKFVKSITEITKSADTDLISSDEDLDSHMFVNSEDNLELSPILPY